MIPADYPVAPPDRSQKPHLTRTAVLLALIGAVLVATVVLVAELTRPAVQLPPEVYQPSYPVTAPAWLESPPAPVLRRGTRPPHPASIYTPPGR
jgi:hypothetical protein